MRVLENQGAAAPAPAKTPRIGVFAQAKADRECLEGEGDAARLAAVGRANAGASDAQVRAYGAPGYRLVEQIAIRPFEAGAQGHQPAVPQIVVAGEGSGRYVIVLPPSVKRAFSPCAIAGC